MAQEAAKTPSFYDVLVGGVSKLIDHELGYAPTVSAGMVYTQTPQGGAPGQTVDAGRTVSGGTIIPGIADKTVYLVGGVVLLLAFGGVMFARKR